MGLGDVGVWVLVAGVGCRHAPPAATETGTAPTSESGTAPGTGDTAATTPARTVLAVSSYFGDRIDLFDPVTGEIDGAVLGVDGAQTVVPTPDGSAWIACAEEQNQIVRIDPATLQIVGVLVGDDPGTPDDETGGLSHPDAAVFGPDGKLYVSSFETDQVLRYLADGTFDGIAVAAGAGGLDGPDIGLTFDRDGHLLVPSWYSDQVLRFDAATGALLGEVIGPDDGLLRPRGVLVAEDGGMWVTGWASGVHHVAPDGSVTRLVEGAAAGLVSDGGALLVATDEELVRAYDAATGADLGVRAQRPLIDGITAVGLLPRP